MPQIPSSKMPLANTALKTTHKGKWMAISLVLAFLLFGIWHSRNRKTILSPPNIEFVSIPAGKFMMGCSPGDNECLGAENPRHEVAISRSFEMGKYEVTQEQWKTVMGSNPSLIKGEARLPVENVNWNDVQKFISKLNALNDGYRYRLPTEAEWEYAARSGATGLYYGDLDAIGWHNGNSGDETHPVGQKQPNGFGLYDMIGNIWEWCSDWYDEDFYKSSPAIDPKGPPTGSHKMIRGGSCFDDTRVARTSLRFGFVVYFRHNSIGFRLCRERL
jgi:formylglycine-generating enzyme required for sulfatase activity